MKTRKTIVLAACLLLVGLASAQLDEVWVSEYNSQAYPIWPDKGKDVVVGNDGSAYAVGSGYAPSGTSSDFVTIKYDPSTGETLWTRFYDGPDGLTDSAMAIAVDPDGYVYVTGFSYSLSGSADYLTIKYEPDGDIATGWPQRYHNYSHDYAYDVEVDASGFVYVTGGSYGSGTSEDYLTIKYEPDGDIAPGWPRRYHNNYSADRARDVEVDISGYVYVTGYGSGQTTGCDYLTIKYEPDGDIAAGWPQRYHNYSDDRACDVEVDISGYVYVTGYSVGSSGNADYLTIKYEPDGDIATGWPQRYHNYRVDYAYDVEVDASGYVYVTGYSYNSSGNFDYLTIKYEPDGNVAPGWPQRYDGGGGSRGGDYGYDVDVDVSGYVYVTGYSHDLCTGTDFVTIKYEPGGDVATGWPQRYHDINTDYAYALDVDASGDVYVTGHSGGFGANTDFITVKYTGSGEQAWAAVYSQQSGASKDDYGKKVVVDALGHVYATGYTKTPDGLSSYVTIKYDPSSGETLWVRIYHNLGEDVATSIAVDASGCVYVTGYSSGASTAYDYLTIKYEPDGDVSPGWPQRYNGSANPSIIPADYARDIAVDASGCVYVTGVAMDDDRDYGYVTIKYEPDGDIATGWPQRYDGGYGTDEGRAVAVGNDGYVYVTGISENSNYNLDYLTIKYEPDGDIAPGWPQRYHRSHDWPQDVEVDASGHVYVTGWSTSDYATIKYEPDGDIVPGWPQCYGSGHAYDVEVDASGCVYVTGYQNGDYATIKYEPDGTKTWDVAYPPPNVIGGIARYDNDGSDLAQALALDNDGHVFVTGYSYGPTTGYDYATLMYDCASGAQLDCKRYSGPGVNTDQALSIATGPGGTVAVTGQSYVPGEYNNIVTIKYSTGTADVGVAEILEPSGLIDTLKETPVVTVQNYGTRKVSFTVWFEIKDPHDAVCYTQSVAVTDLEGETELILDDDFPEWDVPNDLEGQYTCRSWTVLSGDIDPSNDQATSTFGVEASPQSPSLWARWPDVPPGPQDRAVQHGSCAATDPEGRYLYLLKGDNTCEFYRYDPATMTWTTLEPIPEYGRDNVSRTVKEGGTLAQIGGKFYATKGGNSTEFWEYDPAVQPSSHWTQLADVTDGTHSGASACGVSIFSEGYVYLLRASATFDFYRYSVAANAWEVMANAPGPDTEAFKLGSSITCNGMGTIYALKGIYNRFYAYSVATNTWSPLADLPLGPKNKQAKGGAAICYHLGKVYCLKGSNSQEFWIYDCNTNSWVQDADVPLGDDKTRVQDGGTLVYCSLSRYLFATKGGTLELWSYGKLTNYEGPMGAASVLTPVRFSLAVSPSVTSKRARISYGIPKAGNVSLKLYDVTGRSAATFRNGWLEPGRYKADVEAGTLARGIYILKLEADSRNLTRKLVIE